MKICSVEGCERGERTRGLCGTHYERWRRNGHTVLLRELVVKPQCTAADCTRTCPRRRVTAPVLCMMHFRRWLRHGTTDRYPGGVLHPNWAGSEIGYAAAHDRLESHRGKARNHQCIDCSGQAAEWSYRLGSPNERTELQKRKGRREILAAYSPYPDDYDPRCMDCHRAYDEHPWRAGVSA